MIGQRGVNIAFGVDKKATVISGRRNCLRNDSLNRGRRGALLVGGTDGSNIEIIGAAGLDAGVYVVGAWHRRRVQ